MPGHDAWLEKAFEDIYSAKKLIKGNDPMLNTAAYHTQQCAEKALKAFLVLKNQDVPHTHDLERLLLRCSKLDKTFEFLMTDALSLSPYASISRYPDDQFFIDKETVKELIKKATVIFNFVKNKIAPSSFVLRGEPNL